MLLLNLSSPVAVGSHQHGVCFVRIIHVAGGPSTPGDLFAASRTHVSVTGQQPAGKTKSILISPTKNYQYMCSVCLWTMRYFDPMWTFDSVYLPFTKSHILEMYCIVDCITGHIFKKIASLLICILPV